LQPGGGVAAEGSRQISAAQGDARSEGCTQGGTQRHAAYRSIGRMFDGLVESYETVNRFATLGLDYAWRDRLIEKVRVRSDGILLDVACGTGQVLRMALARGLRPRGLVGADFSFRMLYRARRLLPADVRLVLADALALPFVSGYFAAVTCAFGLRNFADPRRALAEMFRVLRPGGRIGVLEFSMPSPGWLADLYGWYLRSVFVPLASLISRERREAYEYLDESVKSFAVSFDIVDAVRKAGFVKVRCEGLTMGIVRLVTAEKP